MSTPPSLFFAHAPFTQTAHTGARIPRSGAGLRPVWPVQIARANAQATIPLQTALPYRRAWSLEPSLPVPISNRLELLGELAGQAGARTRRTAARRRPHPRLQPSHSAPADASSLQRPARPAAARVLRSCCAKRRWRPASRCIAKLVCYNRSNTGPSGCQRGRGGAKLRCQPVRRGARGAQEPRRGSRRSAARSRPPAGGAAGSLGELGEETGRSAEDRKQLGALARLVGLALATPEQRQA